MLSQAPLEEFEFSMNAHTVVATSPKTSYFSRPKPGIDYPDSKSKSRRRRHGKDKSGQVGFAVVIVI